MACCLTAPSHYLNQCWLIICEVMWHSHESKFSAQATNLWKEFENCTFKITATFLRGQWVKLFWPCNTIWHLRIGSSLVQLMACYLSSLTVDQQAITWNCWLITSAVLWHSPEVNFIGNVICFVDMRVQKLQIYNYGHISQGPMS